ncbi:uncharacterized protein EV422DRAFT_571214 [Fimicolochytrium jonesii]|uniref:uncharacterized protein n=1 Tax=Fimicolochytrium jonesii TaxID=1396493 RepID=UPI0022FEE169|nr:uncharacterized protein EV422DRAFT_571214 [Fimicolochytrium jonesii]KAI8816912.1 hypothetical protein EV422DRAFT_571214 [Fimicolochytrium jonesii]
MKAHTTPLFDAHRARLAAAKQKAEEARAFTPASDDAEDDDEEYTSVESSLPHSESVSSYGSTSGGDETAGSELWEEEDYAFAANREAAPIPGCLHRSRELRAERSMRSECRATTTATATEFDLQSERECYKQPVSATAAF